ncbi:MAG: S41 family peptidase [Myxococcota bacterium]
MRSRLVLAAALATSLVLGCDGGEPAPAAPPAKKAEAEPEPAAEGEPPAAEKCVSYEALDPDTLEPLPEGATLAVLDQVWRRVLEKYYDPTIGCLDWPAIRKEYAAKVAAAEDPADAYRLINEMLGRLRQSHFQLHAPGGDDDDEAQGPASPDLQVRYVDDQLLVVHSDDASVASGMALVAVDGRSTSAVVQRAKKKSDRPAELAFFAARGAAAWVSCDAAGEHHTLSLEAPGGKVSEVKAACKRPDGELVTLGNLRNVPTTVSHRMIEGTTVGVLAFNVWMLPMLDRISTALQSLRDDGMTALVLDLRGNPGGVGPMAVSVARLLVSEKVSLGKLQYRKMAQEFNVVPDGTAFTGPIAVLVDEGTASTSEIFAAGMKDIGRITIVGGGPSAGAALPSLIEELPGGAVLQYAVGDYHSPKGTLVEGKGVVPDIVVDEQREDFAAGRDAVLDAAVEHLTKK